VEDSPVGLIAQTYRYVLLDELDDHTLRLILTDAGNELVHERLAEDERRKAQYWREVRQITLKYTGPDQAEQLEVALTQHRKNTHLRGPLDHWRELTAEMCANGWRCLSDEDVALIGALTSNPYAVSDQGICFDAAHSGNLDSLNGLKGVWSFTRYQIDDLIEALCDYGEARLDWYPFQ
jgi:hypothetical protein